MKQSCSVAVLHRWSDSKATRRTSSTQRQYITLSARWYFSARTTANCDKSDVSCFQVARISTHLHEDMYRQLQPVQYVRLTVAPDTRLTAPSHQQLCTSLCNAICTSIDIRTVIDQFSPVRRWLSVPLSSLLQRCNTVSTKLNVT